MLDTTKVDKFLSDFVYLPPEQGRFFENVDIVNNKTKVETIFIEGQSFPIYRNEFWTPKQRQASPLHEVSYRACFKPQLPKFFIDIFTREGDLVYDPFSGRGTTAIETALSGRQVIANDINPLSEILAKPRLFIPSLYEIDSRLDEVLNSVVSTRKDIELDLSVFYEEKTLNDILKLSSYLKERKGNKLEDYVDSWIRMVATNRLSGHSPGFFSVYTLPPNQAVSIDSQRKINIKRNQIPEYRNIKDIIIKKSKNLINGVDDQLRDNLKKVGLKSLFLQNDARSTPQINNESIQLVVTSPPFLDVVQYAKDNWLRCWFNDLDADLVEKNITMSKKIDDWSEIMLDVFKELYRVVKSGGWVAFEVGEVRNGKIKLEEYIVPLGIKSGFDCLGIMINEQIFTKTSNIWGIDNNGKGTNSNRIVIFAKR